VLDRGATCTASQQQRAEEGRGLQRGRLHPLVVTLPLSDLDESIILQEGYIEDLGAMSFLNLTWSVNPTTMACSFRNYVILEVGMHVELAYQPGGSDAGLPSCAGTDTALKHPSNTVLKSVLEA
jgi:hypothetical protein